MRALKTALLRTNLLKKGKVRHIYTSTLHNSVSTHCTECGDTSKHDSSSEEDNLDLEELHKALKTLKISREAKPKVSTFFQIFILIMNSITLLNIHI